jgi:hypothetical protein
VLGIRDRSLQTDATSYEVSECRYRDHTFGYSPIFQSKCPEIVFHHEAEETVLKCMMSNFTLYY